MTMNEKITLSGVPETMLQTLYARAKESQTRGAIYQDAIFDTKKKALPGADVPKRARNKGLSRLHRFIRQNCESPFFFIQLFIVETACKVTPPVDLPKEE